MSSLFGKDDPFEFDTCARDERKSPVVRQSRGDDGRFVELMDGVVDNDESVETGVPDGFFLLTGREAFAVGCFLTDVEVDKAPKETKKQRIADAREREEKILLALLEAESAEIDEKLNELKMLLLLEQENLARAENKLATAAEAIVEATPAPSVASFHQEGATAKFGKKWDRVREAHCPKPLRPKGAASVRHMEVAM